MRIHKLVAILALIYGCNAALAATPQNDGVMLNFVNADIETVVKAIGEITGKNFIIDPRVKGTVNIVSSKPVPRALSYQILLSSLRLQGFSAVEGGGVVKIVPEADAKLHAKASKSIPRGDGDRLITKVFTLKYGNANQLVPVIRPIVSPNNTIAAYPQSNALIVTDYADNIQRIESIIDSIESAASGDTVVVPVLFGSAVELAGSLNKLLQDSGAGADGGKTTIIPDARANVLMVRADTPGKIGKIKSLLKLLDQPSQAGANVRVVYLKNAEAGKVAQTLRALMTGDAGPLQGRTAVSTNGGSSSSLLNQSGSGSGSASSSSGSASAAQAASPVGGDSASSSSSGGGAGGGGSMIQADPTNNALILNVPDSMYQNLRNVIDLLDKRRAQVMVEALVVEVAAQRVMELGVQWQALGALNGNGAGVFGGTNFPGTTNPGIIGLSAPSVSGSGAPSSPINTLATTGGLNIGWVKGTVNIPGIGTVLNMGALARAMETEMGGNIVSSPSLMAMDNEKAKIQIGQEVPILTGQYSNTGSNSNGSVNPFQTYDRKTIGFNLEITPQISEGGSIRMKILQEASTIVPGTDKNPQGPTTNKRMIETIANVDDGGIIAIGGLLQETVSDNESKVPLLGDIPWLGALFRYSNKQRNKTNLMIFIKPTIIRDDLGARSIATDRYNYIIGEGHKAEKEKLQMNLDSALKSLPESGIRSTLEQSLKAQPK